MMWLFKQGLTDTAKAAVKSGVTLMNSAKFSHESALKSYFAIFKFLLKRYVADDSTV